ncbi:PTS fructose IIA subunit family protein [Luteimonas sp. FXH3W]|uniref:PTS fructose IIA subunit family protein n=1 Tax=Aquilutibacter rugosus TaxID=3115820 RepID=A0ABU7UYU7_9GAMM
MSVGVLMVTHPGVGPALLQVVQRMFPNLPLPVGAVEIGYDGTAEQMLPLASAAMRKVDQGDGVLLLVDLYGSTPSNVARQLQQISTRCRRVSALNLPMLLRVLNYPELDLEGLQAMAAQGGRIGIVLDDA